MCPHGFTEMQILKSLLFVVFSATKVLGRHTSISPVNARQLHSVPEFKTNTIQALYRSAVQKRHMAEWLMICLTCTSA